MSLFPLTGDVQKFLLRAMASLERADAMMAQVQSAARNADALLTDVRAALSAAASALGKRG